MDKQEFDRIAVTIFQAAMHDAWQSGTTVMEDGRDQVALESMAPEDLLRAASSYFETTM